MNSTAPSIFITCLPAGRFSNSQIFKLTVEPNETIAGLLQDLGIDAAYTSQSLNSLAAVNSRYLRDLKLNVSGTISSGNLSRKEAYLLALAVAVNVVTFEIAQDVTKVLGVGAVRGCLVVQLQGFAGHLEEVHQLVNLLLVMLFGEDSGSRRVTPRSASFGAIRDDTASR